MAKMTSLAKRFEKFNPNLSTGKAGAGAADSKAGAGNDDDEVRSFVD